MFVQILKYHQREGSRDTLHQIPILSSKVQRLPKLGRTINCVGAVCVSMRSRVWIQPALREITPAYGVGGPPRPSCGDRV